MSFTPVNILPGLVFCAGIVLFLLGWRTAGLILMAVPVVLGLGVLVWALLGSQKADDAT